MNTISALFKRHPLTRSFILVGAAPRERHPRLLRPGTQGPARRLHRLVPAAAGAVVSLARRGLGTIGGRLMWRVTSDYLLAFFDRQLKGISSSLLDGSSPNHPEVVLGAPEDLFGTREP